jgi:hypothetical protein
MTNCIKRVLWHYSDIAKDIILISQLWKLMFDGRIEILIEKHSEFPAVVFLVVLTSIVASELSNLMSLTSHETFTSFSRVKQIFAVILVPFVPAVIHYQESKQEIEQLDAIHSIKKNGMSSTSNSAQKCLALARSKCCTLQTLRAEFKSNENVLEQFTQIFALILVLWLKNLLPALFPV